MLDKSIFDLSHNMRPAPKMTFSFSTNRIPYPKARDQTGDQLLSDIQALVPKIRATAQNTELDGRIPEETIKALKSIGAFKAVVPKRYDGFELPYPYIPQIFRTLGRGCTSTAWCMGFLVYHNFQFGHFGLKAQDEVWSGRGFTMAPGQVMPSGNAKEVDGGYEISGRWGYATGIHHGDWMLLSAPTEMLSGEIQMRRYFVPVENCEILDTWSVVAMKATGSDDVTLENEFVPTHRSMLVADLREGRGEGLALNTDPLWQMPLLSFMVLGAVGPFVGAAEALLEIVSDVMKTKVGAYSGEKQLALMSQNIRIARLSMELDAVIHLWEGHIEDLWNDVSSSQEVTRERRQELRAVTSHVAKTCTSICAELAGCVGSRSYYEDNPIQRFHRDISSLSTHALFEYDHMANLYGSVRMGVDLPPSAMV
jgi:3-hydroxy-9,10-secoandrosta-1,3,5(10)-triene-9,17-dione monooxygenase